MSRKRQRKLNQQIKHELDRSSRTPVVKQEVTGQHFVNPLCSDYENLFPQVRPLINEMKMVHPFGLGRNGARLAASRTPELAALEYPNDDMGRDEFIDLVFATWLTEGEALIQVHKTARGKVVGYTTLPVGCRKWIGGEERFSFITADGKAVELSRDEVMVLRFSRSPKNPDQGVSPATVAHFWAQIQDLLAQYQKAYLENGAVPASITFITAQSEATYLEKRKALEAGLSGARNKNKTIYAWRQVLPNNMTGDEIEVKTIQGNNSTLAIREIMDIASDQLNKAVGVSNFILGDDSSAKYDNAELSTQQFMVHRVYPALVSFWNQFQHELDRILGGLGYSISFDLDIPELTEQVKVKAETKKLNAETARIKAETENEKVRLEYEKTRLEYDRQKAEAEKMRVDAVARQTTVDTLITMINAGTAPEAAVAALGLSAEWLEVARGISGEGVQVSDVHVNEQGEFVHNCAHCHDAAKRMNDVSYEPEFSPDEIVERGIYEELLELLDAIINDELELTARMSEEEIEALVDKIVDRLAEVSDKGAVEAVDDTVKSINKLPTAVLVGIINGNRPKNRQELTQAINAEKTDEAQIDVREIVREKMRVRADDIVRKLRGETVEGVRKILEREENVSRSKGELKKMLLAELPKERAEMIARNETISAFRIGALEQAKAISKKYGLKMQKTWRAHPDECPICAAMDGTTVELDAPFPAETTEKDGVVYAYDHTIYNENGETPNAHVNCRCYFEIGVVG